MSSIYGPHSILLAKLLAVKGGTRHHELQQLPGPNLAGLHGHHGLLRLHYHGRLRRE